MRSGRGLPASKRVLPTAQAPHRHPPQPLPRRFPAPPLIPLSTKGGGCKAAPALRRLQPSPAHGDPLPPGNPHYVSIARGVKAVQRGASQEEHHPGVPSHHLQPRQGAPARAVGIPRLTPSKKPEQHASSAIARLKGGIATLPVHHYSQTSTSAAKRLDFSEEEEKPKRSRRASPVLPKRSSPQKDRTSTASSPAILTGTRTPPIASASANITRRNTEGPHRRRRELQEAGCCGDSGTQRHRVEGRIQLELVETQLDQRKGCAEHPSTHCSAEGPTTKPKNDLKQEKQYSPVIPCLAEGPSTKPKKALNLDKLYSPVSHRSTEGLTTKTKKVFNHEKHYSFASGREAKVIPGTLKVRPPQRRGGQGTEQGRCRGRRWCSGGGGLRAAPRGRQLWCCLCWCGGNEPRGGALVGRAAPAAAAGASPEAARASKGGAPDAAEGAA